MLWLEVVTCSSKGSQRGQGQEVTSHAGVVLLNHCRIVRDAFDLLYFKKSKYFSSIPGSVAFLCLGYGNNRLEHPEFRNCLPHGIAGCKFMMVRFMFDAGRSCIQEEVNPSLGLSKLFVYPGCVMIPASDLGRFGRSQYLCSSSRPGKCVFRPQPAIRSLNASRLRDRRTCLDIDFFFSQMFIHVHIFECTISPSYQLIGWTDHIIMLHHRPRR